MSRIILVPNGAQGWSYIQNNLAWCLTNARPQEIIPYTKILGVATGQYI